MKLLLTQDHLHLKEGEIVYLFKGHTYGVEKDDLWATGVPHTAVTQDSNGGGKFISVPTYFLEEIKNVN